MQRNKFNSIISEVDNDYILEYMPGYIYWKDLNSVYLGCNRNLAEVSHLKSTKDIIGKTDYDFEWGAQQADQFVQDDKFVIETGEIHTSEYQLPTKNHLGMNYIVRSEKRRLIGKTKQVIGILAVAVDITMEREAERLQVENETYLAEKNAQKDFISLVDNMQQLLNTYRINSLNNKIGAKASTINGGSNVKLSNRESQILYYLSLHKTPKEIAIILSVLENKQIAPKTISSIINKGLYPKFDVNSTGPLIDKAISLQLLSFFPKA